MIYKAMPRWIDYSAQEIEADTHEHAAWIYIKNSLTGKQANMHDCAIGRYFLESCDQFIVCHEIDNGDEYNLDSKIFSAVEMFKELDEAQQEFLESKIHQSRE